MLATQAMVNSVSRMLSARLGNWPGEGESHLHLSPKRTVLVGRNGAGKSLLLDGIYFAAKTAVAREPRRLTTRHMPESASIEFLVSEKETLLYSYKSTYPLDLVEPGDIDTLRYGWNESCHLNGKELWRVENGTVTAGQDSFPVPRGLGLLAYQGQELPARPQYATQLADWFLGIRRVEPGFPRHRGKRHELVFRDKRLQGENGRISRLSRQLVSAYEGKQEQFQEFCELIKQTGLSQSVAIRSVLGPSDAAERLDYAAIEFDGCNIGELSDGTLRVAETIWMLLQLGSSDMLLLEEPEIGIHPGLLKKLLDVIDSYAIDHQIVVSTHSLQVVNWADPSEIRLVKRDQNGVVSAAALTPVQLQKLSLYMDEGGLSDFVFGGGTDDDQN